MVCHTDRPIAITDLVWCHRPTRWLLSGLLKVVLAFCKCVHRDGLKYCNPEKRTIHFSVLVKDMCKKGDGKLLIGDHGADAGQRTA
jgi:hypothetical protein